MRVSFQTCDVFTERPFSGNQLLVVPDARGLTTAQMQAIAREINFSESTFVLPPDDPRHAYRQRTFVPLKELPYAGHPTVGTAMVMAWLGKVGGDNGAETVPITIEVGFGPLRLELMRRDGVISRVRMEQGRPAWDEPLTSPELLGKLASGLGVPYETLSTDLPPRTVSTGNRFLIVPLPLAALENAAIDPRTLALVEAETETLGFMCFAFAEGGRLRVRCFVPGAGVSEDPATGSGAGPLGVYLALHGALPGGKPHFFIDQGVEMGRRSEIEVEVMRDGETPVGVRVSGGAVPMFRGDFEI